jgi:acetyl esterase/lipase
MVVDVPEAMLEEARRFNAELEQLLSTVPSVETVPPNVTRLARAEGRGLWGEVPHSPRAVTRTIDGPGGPVPLRIFVPEDRAPVAVYLHIHGGGWTLGAADQHDPLLVHVADAASVAVVSVDYRLAPEHPFPAGPDDCEAAALWLLDTARREFGAERLLVGGESAGAHLCAVTLLRLRERLGSLERFAGANLVFGAFDLSLTPSTRLWGERNLVLNTPIVQWFTDNFLPAHGTEERRHPDISPLYADLAGMPPALFTVGELDPLLDDSLFMAARWEAAGSRATLLVYPEAPHGFTGFPTAIGRRCLADQVGFVTAVAAGGPWEPR